MIGTESKLPEITLAEASAGNCESTLERAAFSLSVTSLVLVPNAKETLRTDTPVVEVALVDSSPSRLMTALSMTEETCASTTSGEAPG
jgi:hypothetical protein